MDRHPQHISFCPQPCILRLTKCRSLSRVTHRHDNIERQSEKGVFPHPPQHVSCKEQAKSFPRSSQKPSYVSLAKLCHMSMLNQSLGWRIWLLRYTTSPSTAWKKGSQLIINVFIAVGLPQFLDGIAEISVCPFIYSPKLFFSTTLVNLSWKVILFVIFSVCVCVCVVWQRNFWEGGREGERGNSTSFFCFVFLSLFLIGG